MCRHSSSSVSQLHTCESAFLLVFFSYFSFLAIFPLSVEIFSPLFSTRASLYSALPAAAGVADWVLPIVVGFRLVGHFAILAAVADFVKAIHFLPLLLSFVVLVEELSIV